MNTESQHGITANADFATALNRYQLWDFHKWWDLAEAGTIVRDLRPIRFTARVELTDQSGLPSAVYIKCHDRPTWSDHWKAWARLTTLDWGAEGEWNALWEFLQAGIPVPNPVLWGTNGTQSLLVTAAIENSRELHHVVKEEALAGTSTELAMLIAKYARIMHGMGYTHQDFYLDHFLHRVDNQQDSLWLIDLHRARKRRFAQSRWVIKDLAQLLYSARHAGIDQALIGRFWRSYLNTRSLHRHKTWRKLIDQKARRIERRCERLGANLDTAISRRVA